MTAVLSPWRAGTQKTNLLYFSSQELLCQGNFFKGCKLKFMSHHWIRLLHQYVPKTPRHPKRLFSKSVKITYSWLWGTGLYKSKKKKTKLLCEQSTLKNCNTRSSRFDCSVYSVGFKCHLKLSSTSCTSQKSPEYNVTCELPLFVGKNCKRLRGRTLPPVYRFF